MHDIILKSREVDKVFGFDDTYLDLARALRQAGKGGRNYDAFAKSRENLENILGGKVEDVDGAGKWIFRKGQHRFPLGVTAEGVKKIAILDTLLSNRYLDPQSIVFIDEVESALHPTAISKLLDIVAALADCGIQFVLASQPDRCHLASEAPGTAGRRRTDRQQGAVEMVGAKSYDLVFMDMQMPEMDGVDATKAIRRLGQIHQPKIVALTANAFEGDREVCLAAGMVGFVAKPFRLEDLRRAICETCLRCSS